MKVFSPDALWQFGHGERVDGLIQVKGPQAEVAIAARQRSRRGANTQTLLPLP
jgi:hypothetical protein